ncbi:MAG: terpene cyclase/mutase family protein [Acidobacteriia bacterium]|nr:terpene cyclase/mutase family protein [Terriglobia bacterium]
MSPETRQKLMDSLNKGAAYLKSQQKPDGTWENHPGVTAMVAAALLHQPGARTQAAQTTAKTLEYLRSLAKPDGGIYVKDIPHYITATAVMALVAAGDPKDTPIIEKGRRYLAEHILDEGEGVSPSNKFYGGLGWGGTSDGGRADIISLEYGLRAMKEAGVAANDAAWQKTVQFLQRTQNIGELNDQGFPGDDGGFMYYPGYSQAGETRSYGAATYAGIMSYAWANVKKDDRRVQVVLKWVRNNYTVDENPGLGQKTVYYYYMVFAKALQAIGEPVIVDAKGVSHNWREDLGRKLLSLQHPEGYWVNTVPDEMQDNKVLVTTFTMMAIEAALQN